MHRLPHCAAPFRMAATSFPRLCRPPRRFLPFCPATYDELICWPRLPSAEEDDPIRRLLLPLLGVVCLCDVPVVRADWQVWTTTQTRRVLRDAPVEHTTAVQLAAARNEWRSFLILVRSDAPVSGVNVVADDLVGPHGAMLPASDARLYRQHQFHITTPSYQNERFTPGRYPDALIPFVHPVTGKPLKGSRLTAARDSIEDCEYMAMLERRRLAAEAEEVVLPLGRWPVPGTSGILIQRLTTLRG